jgi:hypothetical protein
VLHGEREDVDRFLAGATQNMDTDDATSDQVQTQLQGGLMTRTGVPPWHSQ